MSTPHIVKQTITFSDGTETVYNYRGKVVDGILIPNLEVKETVETVEAPAEELAE